MGSTEGNVRAERAEIGLEHLFDLEKVLHQPRGTALWRQSLKSPTTMSGESSREPVGRMPSHSALICHWRPRSNNPRCTFTQ